VSPRSVSTAASERPAIFGAYASRDDVPSYAAAFDEMFDKRGHVRTPYRGIHAELTPSNTAELAARAEARAGRSSTRASPSHCRARSAPSRWTWCPG
jgi:hypothetical protein